MAVFEMGAEDRAPAASSALVAEAAELAHRVLSGDPERLAHSAAVAERAGRLTESVSPAGRATLVAAAWLHDIGYSPALQQTAFHPVDGARYLRRTGWPQPVCELVAHHSGSRFVAAVRPLETSLVEFDWAQDDLSDALTAADQTVGPGGWVMTVEERLADMLLRHGGSSPNALAHSRRAPYLFAAARRVVGRLDASGAVGADRILVRR